MKIFHYALGFPPYRSGGLTKFCIDIMKQQKKMGFDVTLIWPGQINIINKSVQIKKRKENNHINNFEIINPLPISYDEGIIEIERFTKTCELEIFKKFLIKCQPDIIHVHTLMGLHKEFMEAAKLLNIKTIFTVHDFFPICPKVTMFRDGHICESVLNCSLCPQCNLTSLSKNKIFLLQSPLYRKLKNNLLIKQLRKSHRNQYFSGNIAINAKNHIPQRSPNDYIFLRNYYAEMLSLFEMIHCNSSVTERIFRQYFNIRTIKTISISHADIKDNRRIKKYFSDKLRLTYLGPGSDAKGFFLLKAALDELWLTDNSFILNIYFKPIEMSPYIKVHATYDYSELESIFQKTDIVIVPSIWYETFGYNVAEAISYGVPVLISNNVGAKDIIPGGCGIIIKDLNKDTLKKAIQSLNVEVLSTMNQNILKEATIITLEEMTKKIIEQCYENNM